MERSNLPLPTAEVLLEFTWMLRFGPPQTVMVDDPPSETKLANVGCVISSGAMLLVLTIAATDTALALLVVCPTNFMNVVGSVRCTVTRMAGTVSLASVAPLTVAGKLTVTVSLAVPPKPLLLA